MSVESDEVVGLYQRHAEAWAKARERESSLYERPWLEAFCALLPPGASVLDLGCGAGEPIARHLAGLGYRITGVDSSPAMVAMFQARLPGHTALVADMRTLALNRRFHGILAWDSFFHLTPDDQRRLFPIFRAHAAPGAALIFTSGPANGEVLGQFEGEPLYHASLSPEEYRHLLAENGFTVVDHRAEDVRVFGRTVWLALFLLPAADGLLQHGVCSE